MVIKKRQRTKVRKELVTTSGMWSSERVGWCARVEQGTNIIHKSLVPVQVGFYYLMGTNRLLTLGLNKATNVAFPFSEPQLFYH